jgi:hypothetical protein
MGVFKRGLDSLIPPRMLTIRLADLAWEILEVAKRDHAIAMRIDYGSTINGGLAQVG